MINKIKINLINEKWDIIKKDLKVKSVPRTHELLFLDITNKYYRVCNVIYNIKNNKDHIYVVIEEYIDDFKLNNKKKQL